MEKTFVGPQLRQMRRQHGETQAQMARRLGISAAYVNLLEGNQRSLSVKVLMAITEEYGIDWRALVPDRSAGQLPELRAAMRDPIFKGNMPDLPQLRAALDHAPGLVERLMQLYQDHRSLSAQLNHISVSGHAADLLAASWEASIHDFFRHHANHFDGLERAAALLRERIGGTADDFYAAIKRYLRLQHDIQARVLPQEDLPDALRVFDRDRREVLLSEALDHRNRVFQLAHVLGLLEMSNTVADLVSEAIFETAGDPETGRARLSVELTNYFAAALLMPYGDVLREVRQTRYDLDRVASSFGVSFEQLCHRLTTLQREGAAGIPFFFLRLDRAGNVTKRLNATGANLGEQGGGCPAWGIHDAFRAPGLTHAHFAEMPDGARFLTLARTVDRPSLEGRRHDRRMVVVLACDAAYARQIAYADHYAVDEASLYTPVGLACALCPRQACPERAHEPLHLRLRLDADRRGGTRYES